MATRLESESQCDWPTRSSVAAELRRQHDLIAALENKLEAVGAGGVSGRLVSKADELPVAWAVFAESGQCRMWSQNESHTLAAAKDIGRPVVPLYTRPAQCLQQSAPVPMTDEQRGADYCFVDDYLDFNTGVKTAKHHHGITSKAEGAQQ